jgi:DNA polymerase-3 subunit alpha
MYLFLDFETTGFPNGNLRHDHPDQARVIQVGYVLTDEAFRVYQQYERIVKIDNGNIHEGALKVHGISADFANKWGRSQFEVALAMHKVLLKPEVTHVIGHNLEFDMKMLDLLYLQTGAGRILGKQKRVCTMELGRDVCGLLTVTGKPKNPKLAELYWELFHAPFTGHSALADAQCVKECMRAMVESGKVVL